MYPVRRIESVVGNVNISKILLIAWCVLKIIMWSLELVTDEKRFIFVVIVLKPVEG